MAQFIHLTDERRIKQIAKNGIKPSKLWQCETRYVFATPVHANFMVSHQWLRELKRWGGVRTIVAVQFRIPDDDPVEIGHYGQTRLCVTAAKAIHIFQEHRYKAGLEVLIPRQIAKREIMRIYTPTQLVGWRFSPTAKGNRPIPTHRFTRGQYNGRKIRAAADPWWWL